MTTRRKQDSVPSWDDWERYETSKDLRHKERLRRLKAERKGEAQELTVDGLLDRQDVYGEEE